MANLHTCPDCKCQFVQPFKCITCGAEKLYDLTVRTQAARIKQLGAAFKGYARHVTSPDLCPAVNFFADERGECTCGLDEWIAAIGSQSDASAKP